LLQRHFDVAALLLRACVRNHPELLSARLALATLSEFLGTDAAPVLQEALQCNPYAALVGRQLAARNRHEAGGPAPDPLRQVVVARPADGSAGASAVSCGGRQEPGRP
jgi:hypothetical protein